MRLQAAGQVQIQPTLVEDHAYHLQITKGAKLIEAAEIYKQEADQQKKMRTVHFAGQFTWWVNTRAKKIRWQKNLGVNCYSDERRRTFTVGS